MAIERIFNGKYPERRKKAKITNDIFHTNERWGACGEVCI